MKPALGIGLVAALVVSGCALGPDFRRPAAPAFTGYRATPAVLGDQRLVEGAALPAEWWRLFGSAQLNSLVQRALAANPTIGAARAALRVAQENAAAQRGPFWPQVSASLTPTRQKNADALSSPLNVPSNPFSLHTAQLNIAYVPDVFGGNSRLAESLDAQSEVQECELAAARLSLTSNVVMTAVQEAELRGQIDALQEIVELQTRMLDLARRQWSLGAIAESGVLAQEAVLAQSRAALPPLRKQLAQNRDLLTALAGEFPDQGLAESFDLAHLELPLELPLSLPSTLVAQRPDIRAAEAQAHAASAQVGAAFANRLPQFAITVGVGSVATVMSELARAGGGFWSIGAAITQPIFQGGTLSHRQSAAEAAYEQALAQYRSTVIAAFQNVADALHALEQDAAALSEAATAERVATRSLAIARRQLELGDISFLVLLNAEQGYQQARGVLVQARANRYADTAALFQALGGGWWDQVQLAQADR